MDTSTDEEVGGRADGETDDIAIGIIRYGSFASLERVVLSREYGTPVEGYETNETEEAIEDPESDASPKVRIIFPVRGSNMPKQKYWRESGNRCSGSLEWLTRKGR